MKLNLYICLILCLGLGFTFNSQVLNEQVMEILGEESIYEENATTYVGSNSISQYEPDVAQQIGAFALNAYCKQKKIEKWSCGKTCKQYPNMQDIVVIKDKKKNQAYLGYYPDNNAIVIAWRGTLPLRNWLEDFDMTLIDYPYCSECKIHQGFYKAYEAMQEDVWEAFYNLQEQHPGANIWLTGHSLGAALSTVHAGDFVQRGITELTWYNFGSPRVGDQNFASWLQNAISGKLFRVTHHKDPIPHAPTRNMGYWHLAEEVFYESKSDVNEYHLLCDMSGEDPNCSDKYGFDLLFFMDHLEYVGYNWIERIALCII